MSSAPATTESHALEPAKSPVGVGAIGVLGPVLALLLTAAGVVLVHDALAWGGVITGTPWSQRASAINGLTPDQWTVPVAILAVVIGLVLLVIGMRRRPRRGIALTAETGVFLRPADVARLARARAEDVDGVLSARATATRKTVTVSVTGTGSDVGDSVREAVTSRLSALDPAPTVVVRTEGPNR